MIVLTRCAHCQTAADVTVTCTQAAGWCVVNKGPALSWGVPTSTAPTLLRTYVHGAQLSSLLFVVNLLHTLITIPACERWLLFLVILSPGCWTRLELERVLPVFTISVFISDYTLLICTTVFCPFPHILITPFWAIFLSFLWTFYINFSVVFLSKLTIAHCWHMPKSEQCHSKNLAFVTHK